MAVGLPLETTLDALILNYQLVAYRRRAGDGHCEVFTNPPSIDQGPCGEVIAHLPRGFDTLTDKRPTHGQNSLTDRFAIRGVVASVATSATSLCGGDIATCRRILDDAHVDHHGVIAA